MRRAGRSYCRRTSSESTVEKARQRISLFNRSLCYCVMQTNERSGMQNRTIIHGFPLLLFFFPLSFNAKLRAIKYFIQAAFTLTCYLRSSCPGLCSSDVIAGNARVDIWTLFNGDDFYKVLWLRMWGPNSNTKRAYLISVLGVWKRETHLFYDRI
jgi:hypothetical protein